MSTASCDLFVIGGGINGAAVARDAAGRGLKVVLAEQNDYASATSSASSKLIHGGLRYLENFQFSFVREALSEREYLLHNAPHLVHHERFLMPLRSGHSRSSLKLYAGLKLYDLLAGSSSVPKSGHLSTKECASSAFLRHQDIKTILYYSDCRTKDSRLVLAQLLDARSRGADIGNYRDVKTVQPVDNGYHVTFTENGVLRQIIARYVVNTSGPWVNDVNMRIQSKTPHQKIKLVRGSHIVLPMPDPGFKDCFTLQNTDGRIVFVMPWPDQKHFVIGTTDMAHSGSPSQAACTVEEMVYLLGIYNTYFQHPGGPLRPRSVVWHWSGVRTLIDDGKENLSKTTREAALLSQQNGAGGLVSVYGGKLTTHRKLAELVMLELKKMGASMGGTWTRDAKLTGGQMSRTDLIDLARHGPGSLALPIRERMVFLYGDQCVNLFEEINKASSQPAMVTSSIPEIELIHAYEKEDARTADDFLLRRTELFINSDATTRDVLKNWFTRKQSGL